MSNQVIFIDANIYLRFFDSNSKEFKKLLTSIKEISKNIFITQQIKSEIDRNKLEVFIKSFNNHIAQFQFQKTTLPEHIETSKETELKEWNKKSEKLQKTFTEQKNKLKQIAGKLINNIYNNSDKVSHTLNELYNDKDEVEPDHGIVEKARFRKEIGNPPGKQTDPIGDQITWEQLLTKANEISNLWIISNDYDYYDKFDNTCYLNPFLLY